MDGVTKSDVISWIEKYLKNENFSNYDITLVGKTEKGDGYMGDILFVNVVGANKDHEEKDLNLVVKHSKANEHMRQKMPVSEAFQTEINFYKTIIPAFQKFQEDHKILDAFDSVPKCYATFMMEKMEVVILGNLKSLGYDIHDRMKPLNFDHQKLVVTEYGKFHALSFAFRDQKPKEFNALTDHSNVFKLFFQDDSVKENFQSALDEAVEILEDRGDFSLVEAIKKRHKNNVGDMIYDISCVEIPQSVITHGDCWNNNFMFKYENDDQSSPSNVMFLDWQVSTLRSPVFDLSLFIYTTSSAEELDRFDELLDVYYSSFSNFLRRLGSDPEELFPYSSLKDHWAKYSVYGILFAPLMLKLILCDKEDAPDMVDLGENDNMSYFLGIDIKDKDLYYERVKPVLEHHFLNSNIVNFN